MLSCWRPLEKMQLLETSETGFSDTRFSVTGFSVDVLKARANTTHVFQKQVFQMHVFRYRFFSWRVKSANRTQVFQKQVFQIQVFQKQVFQKQVFQKQVFQKQVFQKQVFQIQVFQLQVFSYRLSVTGVCFICLFFALLCSIWISQHVPKKKARVSPRPIGPKNMWKTWLCRQCTFLAFWLIFLFFLTCFFSHLLFIVVLYFHGNLRYPPKLPPPGNKALIAGLIKGNQWVFIVPDHKAGYFLGGSFGGGTLDSQLTNLNLNSKTQTLNSKIQDSSSKLLQNLP